MAGNNIHVPVSEYFLTEEVVVIEHVEGKFFAEGCPFEYFELMEGEAIKLNSTRRQYLFLKKKSLLVLLHS